MLLDKLKEFQKINKSVKICEIRGYLYKKK
jgi:hypothetical protein